jgi:RDD family
MDASAMKCSKCGYDNPPEGTEDGRCDECGHPLLPEADNLSYQISDSASRVVSTSTIKRVVNYVGDLVISQFIVLKLINIPSRAGDISSSVGSGGSFVLIIFMLFLYYFLCEAGCQQTPAKFITRTKVVMKNGSTPSASSIALRTLIRFVPFIVFSMSAYGTWWHDQWTNTRVVDSKR